VVVSGLSAQATFVPVPQMAAPSVTATELPTLQYELTVTSLGNMQASAMTSKRRLAPLPTITVTPRPQTNGGISPVCSGGVCPAFTQARVTYTNAASVGVFSISPTTTTAIRLPQGESAIEAGIAPVNVIPATPSSSSTTADVCDMRQLNASDVTTWRGTDPATSYPVRLWARAPLISGCQLHASTDVSYAQIGSGSTAGATYWCAAGLHVVPPANNTPVVVSTSSTTHGPPTAGGGTGSGSGSTSGPCHEGDACTITPSGCQASFSVTGTMHCTGKTGTCVPGAYCPNNAHGANCGGTLGDPCSINPMVGGGWCTPSGICGLPCSSDGKTTTCQCRSNPACTTNQWNCWAPQAADGSWPGRGATDDACGSSGGGDDGGGG